MKLTLSLLGAVVGTMLVIPMMLTWERPPMLTAQFGPDGLAMGSVENPRRVEAIKALNTLNVANQVDPPATPSGVKASANPDWKNIQILGDLDTEEFNRLMGAITRWMAPAEATDPKRDNSGCNYCHNPDDMASDEIYTKVVSRRMIQMTKQINTVWQPHTLTTGVTCYTCHRGNAVPANTWVINTGAPQHGYAGSRQGQNLATKALGSTAMDYDPFTTLFSKDGVVRVAATTALAGPTNGATIQATEKTYALMMHISKALGVNCTFCHDSRSFGNWAESRPQRVTAWQGIQMMKDLNGNFMDSLAAVFPANRKGPHGDVMKVNCTTCHNGVNKPFYGVSITKDYPELTVANP
jgi:photosynthetic reaction center cytochrome c subunit